MTTPGHELRWPCLVALLLGALSPLVVNVVLVQVVQIVHLPETLLRSGLFTDRASFIGAVRILNGVFLGLIIAVVFGVPLGVIARRRVGVVMFVFAVAMLGASLVWHLNHEWGLASFTQQWLLPEMWLSLFAVGLIALFVSRYRSGAKVAHVAP